MNKVEQFQVELSYLKEEEIKKAAEVLISLLPDYFFQIAASSTGKYHPKYALGEGGLLRHTKAAVRIAYELLQDPVIGDKYTYRQKDLILLALMLHDGVKLGFEHSQYTKVDHPLLASQLILDHRDKLSLTDEDIQLLTSVINAHMGPWNKDFDGNEILPVPTTKCERFVHMCDFLASKKFILIPFDEKNHIIS